MADKAIEQQLLALEKEYWQAIKDKNPDPVMRLTDDPCIITGASGVRRIRPKDMAGMMDIPSFTLHDFRISDDAQVQMLTADVAVLAYNVHEEATVDGKRVTLDAADASTWRRRDGHWVCALHTESVKGDPWGRDRVPARR
jgi:hypothetical protein